MSYSTPDYIIAFIVIVGFCFICDFILLFFFGILKHMRSYHFSYLQRRACVMMFLSFVLQCLFVIGFFRYEGADIVDIFIEIIISVLLLRFFNILKIIMTTEVFVQTHLNPINLDPSEDNKEVISVYQQLKTTPLDDFKKTEVQNTCISVILLQKKTIEPLGFGKLFSSSKIIKNRQEALAVWNYYYKVLLLYIIVIPLCFIAIAISNRRGAGKTAPRTVISIIKMIVTVFCLMKIFKFMKNLEDCLKEYGLFYKFFSVKLIIFFVIVQSIILGFVDTSNSIYNDEEMGQIINYFMLNIENCLIAFLWIYSFGYSGLCIVKYRALKQKYQTKLENGDKNEEQQKVLSNF